VKVRNGGDRLIVQLQGSQGKSFVVDLGRPSELMGQQNQQGQQAQQQQAQQNKPVKQGHQLTARREESAGHAVGGGRKHRGRRLR
jgi:hypothetical protein